jgi:hypothetical protein
MRLTSLQLCNARASPFCITRHSHSTNNLIRLVLCHASPAILSLGFHARISLGYTVSTSEIAPRSDNTIRPGPVLRVRIHNHPLYSRSCRLAYIAAVVCLWWRAGLFPIWFVRRGLACRREATKRCCSMRVCLRSANGSACSRHLTRFKRGSIG